MKLSGFLAIALLLIGCATTHCTKPAEEPTPAPSVVQTAQAVVRKLVSPTTIQLNGGIDDAKAAEFIPALLEACAAHDHVSLEINTEGGFTEAGFRIAKAIEDCGAPVDCIVDGNAQSYGFYLLQSCRIRAMTRRSVLMMHEMLYPNLQFYFANRFKLEDYARNLEIGSRAMAEHYQHRMEIPIEVILQKTYRQDWLMGWQEAVQYHAVDYVFVGTQEAVRAFDLAHSATKK